MLSHPTEHPSVILVAEDDADDRELIRDAFAAQHAACELAFVGDGNELMDYLLHRRKYEHAAHPLPSLILLDVNMPRKDGREALKEIRNHRALRHIPVVTLSTSSDGKLVKEMYELGTTSFYKKPERFVEYIGMASVLLAAWLGSAAPRVGTPPPPLAH